MKAVQFHISKRGTESIKIELDDLPRFYPFLHFHYEIQITRVMEGKGYLVAGSGLVNYEPGDVFILGSNLPHVFKSTSEGGRSKALSVYFNSDFGGFRFWDLPETRPIRQFLIDSKKGYIIRGLDKEKHALFSKIKSLKKFEKILALFQILNSFMSARKEAISAVLFNNPPSDISTKKMDIILDFLLRNFKNPIRLAEISSQVNMSPESFCRFFRRKTRKSFKTFLNELKVNHACKLILENDYYIKDVACSSGFRNVSNFNRQFLKVTGMSPRQFRQSI